LGGGSYLSRVDSRCCSGAFPVQTGHPALAVTAISCVLGRRPPVLGFARRGETMQGRSSSCWQPGPRHTSLAMAAVRRRPAACGGLGACTRRVGRDNGGIAAPQGDDESRGGAGWVHAGLGAPGLMGAGWRGERAPQAHAPSLGRGGAVAGARPCPGGHPSGGRTPKPEQSQGGQKTPGGVAPRGAQPRRRPPGAPRARAPRSHLPLR
jgi:hypothetical protein